MTGKSESKQAEEVRQECPTHVKEKATFISECGLYFMPATTGVYPERSPERSEGQVEGLPHTWRVHRGPHHARFWRDRVGVPSARRGLTCGVCAASEPRAAILSERSESKDPLRHLACVSEAGASCRNPERSEDLRFRLGKAILCMRSSARPPPWLAD